MEIYWTRDAAKVVPRSMSAMLTIVELQSQSFGGDAPSMRNHRIARFSAASLSRRSYRVSHAALRS